MGPCDPWNQKQVHFCFVCNGPGTTRHHLIPGDPDSSTVRLCRNCHDDVHYYFSHHELGSEFNDAEKLKAELLIRKPQGIEILEWLQDRLAKAEHSVRARKQAEVIFRGGTESQWQKVSKETGSPFLSKEQRIELAERDKRIGAKCCRDVEILKNLIATLSKHHIVKIPCL